MKRYFERLQTIDYLIRIKGTGTPTHLARRLRISERTLFEFLKMMKELGAPIGYDRHQNSYYYTQKGGFNVRFIRKEQPSSIVENEYASEKPFLDRSIDLAKSIFGIAKDKIIMSKDFNDSIEDFNNPNDELLS